MQVNRKPALLGRETVVAMVGLLAGLLLASTIAFTQTAGADSGHDESDLEALARPGYTTSDGVQVIAPGIFSNDPSFARHLAEADQIRTTQAQRTAHVGLIAQVTLATCTGLLIAVVAIIRSRRVRCGSRDLVGVLIWATAGLLIGLGAVEWLAGSQSNHSSEPIAAVLLVTALPALVVLTAGLRQELEPSGLELAAKADRQELRAHLSVGPILAFYWPIWICGLLGALWIYRWLSAAPVTPLVLAASAGTLAVFCSALVHALLRGTGTNSSGNGLLWARLKSLLRGILALLAPVLVLSLSDGIALGIGLGDDSMRAAEALGQLLLIALLLWVLHHRKQVVRDRQAGPAS